MGAVNIMADGVTLDGFEVDGSLMPGNHEVINAYGVSDVSIINNIVHGATAGTWDGMGIAVWDWDAAKTVDNALIQNNEVYDTGRMGIFCMDLGSGEYDLTEGHTITDNTVYDTWKKGNDWGDAGGAIQINVGKDCTIGDNTVYNTTSSNYTDYYNPCIYMFGSGTGNNITGNTMSESDAGITLWISGEGGSPINWEGDTASSPEVHYNKIYNNAYYGAYSINAEGTPMVMDATYNWWGDITGPYHETENPDGLGNAVSDYVDFKPWFGDEEMTTLEPHSTYLFDYAVPEVVVAGEDTEIPVTFQTDELGYVGYDSVRFSFNTTGPGDVTFNATDSEDVEHSFVNSGYWGPPDGFDLPADYTATTDWTLNFSEPGEYTITFSLIEAPDGEVIAGIEGSEVITVRAEDILDHYRHLHEPYDEVTTEDLLDAADDWIAGVVPPGFDEPISTAQLLQLADEWLAG
jgi:parallel beta-helix repeat protein